MMNISQTGIKLIASFEGCVLTAYKDAVGVLTIGYGHTGDVKTGQHITQAQAEALLKKDLEKFVHGVVTLLKVKVNQNQFDALISFAFNLGCGTLEKSTLLSKLNHGDVKGASAEFVKFVHAGGKVLPGLVKRRNAEQKLFNTPVK